MKKLAAAVLMLILISINGIASAKVYTSFESYEKFVPGDIVRIDNSPAFPAYKFELLVQSVNISEEGNCVVYGRRTMTHKITGKTHIDQGYGHIVAAQKKTMTVTIDAKENPPSENEQQGSGAEVTNSQSNEAQQNANNQQQNANSQQQNINNADTSQSSQTSVKKEKTIELSPLRKPPYMPWYARLGNWFVQNIWIILGMLAVSAAAAVFVLRFLKKNNIIKRKPKGKGKRHNDKESLEMKEVILSFLCIVSITFNSTAYAVPFVTYGGGYERQMLSIEENKGIYRSANWNTGDLGISYSQPLVDGDFVYHYAGDTVYKINGSNGSIVAEAFLGGNDLSDGRPPVAMGYMSKYGKYIFVGDRTLGIWVIDTDTMQKWNYSIFTDPGLAPLKTELEKINKDYGTKGIVSAPYVEVPESYYEGNENVRQAYFGTSVGFLYVIQINVANPSNIAAILTNYNYQTDFGESNPFDIASGESFCLTTSPVANGESLYIGTPCDSSFNKYNGYICKYDAWGGNMLVVVEKVEGGVNTTMACIYDMFVFGDSLGNAHFVSVSDNYVRDVEQVLAADFSDIPNPDDPCIKSSPAVYNFNGGQTTVAVFPVSGKSRYSIMKGLGFGGYGYEQVATLPVTPSGSENGPIANSPLFLQMGDDRNNPMNNSVYLLYTDNNAVCAINCNSDYNIENKEPAPIFQKENVLSGRISFGSSAITSQLTAANSMLLFSDKSGKLYCVKIKTDGGDLSAVGIEVSREELNGTYTPLGEGSIIEAGGPYRYRITARFASSFTWEHQNMPVNFSIWNGEMTQKISLHLDQDMASQYSAQISVPANGQTEFTCFTKFPIEFEGTSCVFMAEINPAYTLQNYVNGDNRIVEAGPGDPYANNIAISNPIMVTQRDVNLYFSTAENDVFPENNGYIPIDEEEPGIDRPPVIIYGVVYNASRIIDVYGIPMTLKILDLDNNGALIRSYEKSVDIPARESMTAGPGKNRLEVYFTVEQDIFEIGHRYRIEFEINPVRSDGSRAILEITPNLTDGVEIYKDNVHHVEVTAADRTSLDSYNDAWIEDGVLHRVSASLNDRWIKYLMNGVQDGKVLKDEDEDDIVSIKSGYGMEIDTGFTITDSALEPLDWETDVDWDSIDWDDPNNKYHVRLYIARADAGLASHGMALKELSPGDCAEMLALDENGEPFDMNDMNEDDATEDGKEAIYEYSLEKYDDSNMGAEKTSSWYLPVNKYSPKGRRCVYLDYDVPNTDKDRHAIIISGTFWVKVGNHVCKVRRTEIMRVLEVKGSMYDDDESHALPYE